MTNQVPYLDFEKFEKLDLVKKYDFFRTNKLFEEVIKIKDIESGEIFIANISRPEDSEKEEAPLRMAKIVYNLDHPSILEILGYSKIQTEDEKRTVVITDYFSNPILSEIINAEKTGKPVPGWNNTKKLITIYGIASGILYLHKHNLIHRDIKPSKILMDDQLLPKIRGFNLLINCEDKAREKQIKGTPEYMAPEILTREPSTKAMDVYSFGMIMYELITLKKPFEDIHNPNVIQVLQRVKQGRMPSFDDSTPDSYRNLIQRCWAENPEERPTFDEIVRSLRTDKAFLIDGVDKEEYMNYIRFLDHYTIIKDRRKSALNFIRRSSVNETQILKTQIALKTNENELLKEEIKKLKQSLAEEMAKCRDAMAQLEKCRQSD